MTQARGRAAKLIYAVESAFGVTPESPSGVVLPFISHSLKESQRLNDDATIRGRRDAAQPSRGNISVDGSVVVPLDVVAIGWWLRALFGAPATSGPTAGKLTGGSSATAVLLTWTAVETGSFKISINGVEQSITGLDFSDCEDMDDVATVIETGIQAIGTGGFTLATCVWSIDHFIITSGTTGATSTVSVLSAAAAGIDISGAGATPFMDGDTGHGVATAGVSQYVHIFKIGESQPSEVLEVGYTDIEQYLLFNGCKIGKLALPFGGDAQPQVTLDIMGAKQTVDTDSFDSDAAEISLTKLSNFQLSIKEAGSALANAVSGDLSIDAALDGEQYVIGGNGVRGDIPEGIMQITGTLRVLFENMTLLNKAINNTETSLELTYVNGVYSLAFLIPEALYERTSPAVEGAQGVLADLSFRGYYENASEESAIVVTLVNDVASYA